MATWKKITGTVDEKIQAILESSAFIICWGFRPPVQYNVSVDEHFIHWTESDEGRRSHWKISTLRRRLTELGNPDVEISKDY